MAGAYNYSVIVSNATGSVTSAPAVLTVYMPGPATNFTLNFGGTPIVQVTVRVRTGNRPIIGAMAIRPMSPNFPIRTAVMKWWPARGCGLPFTGTTGNIFPGDQPYVIDGGGVFENNTLNAVGELRFKNNSAASTNYFNQLVLNGGQLDLGDNTSLVVLQGQLKSFPMVRLIYVDSISGQ